MFKVTFQLHGSPEVYEKLFQARVNASYWVRLHADVFSMTHLSEGYH